MPIDEERGRAMESGLKTRLVRLYEIARGVTAQQGYREDDHLGLMTLCFLGMQLEHAISVRDLAPRKDASLIARAMLEGTAMLKWAARDPERPKRWRAYVAVEELNWIDARIARGEERHDQRSRVLTAISENEELLFTDKAKNAKAAGRPLPKHPYHSDWRGGTRIKDVFAELNDLDLHSLYYSDFSSWVHWSPQGLHGLLQDDKNGKFTVSSASYAYGASALILAIFSLLEVAVDAAEHFELNEKMKELAEFRDQFGEFLESSFTPRTQRPEDQGVADGEP